MRRHSTPTASVVARKRAKAPPAWATKRSIVDETSSLSERIVGLVADDPHALETCLSGMDWGRFEQGTDMIIEELLEGF